MTKAIARLLDEVDRLSLSERAELADHLAEKLFFEIPPEIEQAHLQEVRKRVAQVESGEVTLIDGPQVMEAARKALSDAKQKRK